MARSFLDTSALVKYYHPEEGTGEVTRVVQERNAHHSISRLGIVEAQHAFAMKLRTREITDTDFEGLRQRLLRDLAQGQFQHVRVTELHYREAERLIVAYRRRRFRTLDALQLAAA
jgi:predicted nucleic acid-binding protein